MKNTAEQRFFSADLAAAASESPQHLPKKVGEEGRGSEADQKHTTQLIYPGMHCLNEESTTEINKNPQTPDAERHTAAVSLYVRCEKMNVRFLDKAHARACRRWLGSQN